MSSVRAEGAYVRALAAFQGATLSLLHGRYSPFAVAALSQVFTADRSSVAVDDAHVEISEILDELRAAGYDDDERGLPAGTGREVCRYWVQIGWLVRQFDADAEIYRLSADAVSALEITGRTGQRRSRVSNSRVRTLLDAVERLSGNAAEGNELRLTRLRDERLAIDAEIARLEAGESDPFDDDELLEEAENVLHLARELPADFTSVAESIRRMQRDVVAQLRHDDRPTGEVLREYLRRSNEILQSTVEGRAFAGALRLLGDPDRIDALTDQLTGLLQRPFAQHLDAQQRAELDAISRRVDHGVQEVLTAQRRASQVIAGQVRTHDPARDRLVDDLLRDVISGLQSWAELGAGDEAVDPLRRLPVAAIGHLRQSASSVRPPGAPAPLRPPEDVEYLDADTRAWGGPRYTELEAYVGGLGESFDLADAFAHGPATTRRPVDLVGLLEIAHRNGMTESEEISVVEAQRPDGSTRKFAFAAVTARTKKEPTHE